MPLHRVAHLSDLQRDRGLQVEFGETQALLVLHGDEVRAFQAFCPHAGAPLADGAICNGHLICPWHKAEFAVDDGHLCEPPALDALIRYPTQVIDGQIHVDDQRMVVPEPTLTKDARRCGVCAKGKRFHR
jgi:nitrite reductase/ring-hydroxylating ferredoxin subunit